MVLGLIVLAVPMRIWQSQQITLKETAVREDRLEEELDLSIQNFAELEEMYLELKQENIELKQANKEITDWQEFICTGYSTNDGEQGTNNIVATNFNLDYTRVKNLPIVASNCIPLYTLIEIKGLGGFIVLDTGLGYKTGDGWEDENWIDILFDSKEEALEFGVKELEVRVIK